MTPGEVFDAEFGRFDVARLGNLDPDEQRLFEMCTEFWLAPGRAVLARPEEDFAQKWLRKPIYADIYDAPEMNAVSKEHHEYGLIGTSFALVRNLFVLFVNLMRHPSILPDLGIEDPGEEPDLQGLIFTGFPKQKRRVLYALNLFTHSASFVFWHEMQHLMRGHHRYLDHRFGRSGDGASRLLEFGETATTSKEQELRQLIEIDADFRGGRSALSQCGHNPESWHGGEGFYADASDFAFSWGFALSMTMIFMSTLESKIPWRSRNHPPVPIRGENIFSATKVARLRIRGQPVGDAVMQEQLKKASFEAIRLWDELQILGGRRADPSLSEEAAEVLAYYQNLLNRASGPLDLDLAPFKRSKWSDLRLDLRTPQALGDLGGLSSMFDEYPSVQKLIVDRTSAMWHGIRLLVKFPQPDVEYGFEFETAMTLCNLLSGLSVVLYDADLAGEHPRSPKAKPPVDRPADPAERNERCYKAVFSDRDKFVLFLKTYWPWELDDGAWESSADCLYEWLRCKNVHTLGLAETRRFLKSAESPIEPKYDLVLRKRPPGARLSDVEQSTKRPHFFPPLLETSDDFIVISVETLYWGTYRSIVKMASDRVQMGDAERRLRAGQYHLVPCV